MSFIQRLTKNTNKPYKKETHHQRQPLKLQVQQKKQEKRGVKFEDFQKNHSDLKDMLKFFEPQKNTNRISLNEKVYSVGSKPIKQKNSVMQSKKQNIRNKTRQDQPPAANQTVIKYRKKSDQIESKEPKSYSFLMNNLKNNFPKLSNKKEEHQNPEFMNRFAKHTPLKLNQMRNSKKNRNECGKLGLQNIGNTCYMNSVLQCLFHYSHFSQELRDTLNSSQQNEAEMAVVIMKYLDLYDGIMKKNSSKDLSTLPLKKSVSKMCSMFIDFQQEDAHQFLRQMLDTMHQQINLVRQAPSYKQFSFSLVTDNLATVVQQYQKFYKRYDNSFIYDAFCGQMCSFVTCSNCGKESLTLQNFLDISLPIIKGQNSLQKLIQSYFDSESLWDFYSCQACHKKVKNSVKKIDLWDPPNFLIINLKRSQFGKKNTERISIPTKTLNFKKFMKNRTQKVQKSGIYRLSGIVHHRGALDGGHYWATVRQSNIWYKADDASVTKCKTQTFQTELEKQGSDTAYLLFYELI